MGQLTGWTVWRNDTNEVSPNDPRIYEPLPGENPGDLSDEELLSALEEVEDRVDLLLEARGQFTERLIALKRGNFIQRIFADTQTRVLSTLEVKLSQASRRENELLREAKRRGVEIPDAVRRRIGRTIPQRPNGL